MTQRATASIRLKFGALQAVPSPPNRGARLTVIGGSSPEPRSRTRNSAFTGSSRKTSTGNVVADRSRCPRPSGAGSAFGKRPTPDCTDAISVPPRIGQGLARPGDQPAHRISFNYQLKGQRVASLGCKALVAILKDGSPRPRDKSTA